MTQRPIKFRAWDEKKKLYATPYEVMDFLSFSWPEGTRNLPGPLALVAELWTLEQFTGLLDKNGKEIYEGDIIQAQYPGELEQIMERQGKCYGIVSTCGAFRARRLTSEDNTDVPMLEDLSFRTNTLKGYAVIGNIHENPDLIESGEKQQEA